MLKSLKETDETGKNGSSAGTEEPDVNSSSEDLYPIPVRYLVRGEAHAEDIMRGREEIPAIDYLPQAKQPLRISPARKRLLKEYKSILEFQVDYPTKEKREKFVRKLMNYEIDELMNLCNDTRDKNYYESLKKQEKVFEFRKCPDLILTDAARIMITACIRPMRFGLWKKSGISWCPQACLKSGWSYNRAVGCTIIMLANWKDPMT